MEDKLFRNVLVPVNASDLSERVINKVEQMALHGILGDIYIMTIWDFHNVDYSKLHAPNKEKMLINQAQAVIDKYAGQLKSQGIVIKSILTGGDPATAIL
ncbi:MAG: universal stress protein, partial [Syntrophomonas sp.]|nr:universal stress protein [Syntrophomonas sp.]